MYQLHYWPGIQGRGEFVVSEPIEITDPPKFFTEEMLKRFPSLKAKQAEIDAWWEKERTRQQSLQDVVEKLVRKVNSTS